MKLWIPQVIRKPLRAVRNRFRLLSRSCRNAAMAFHPTEFGYQLEIGKFGDFEIAYRAGTADEKVIQQAIEENLFFKGIPECRPASNHVVVDIGAHIGMFSLQAAQKSPQGRVFAIECSRESFNYLRLNVALNKMSNIEVSRLALSDTTGEIRLFHADGNWGHSIMKPLSSSGESVPADTLVNFFQTKQIDHCDLIKFNCEGAEFPILMSSPVELLRRVDLLLIQYHTELRGVYTVEQLARHLESAGFKTREHLTFGHGGWMVAYRD